MINRESADNPNTKLSKLKRGACAPVIGALLLIGCSSDKAQVDSQVSLLLSSDDVGGYNIACYGPAKEVEVKEGDSITALMYTHEIGALTLGFGRPDIPKDVYTEAVALLNGFEDPSLILESGYVVIPNFCIPS